MKALLHLLCLSILLMGLSAQECHAERKKKVLVLHSYHQGLEWTDNITKGIQSVFVPFHDLYEIHYEYLDTKRNTGDEYMDQMVRFINAKHQHIKYEVVIVSDNNALSLLNEGKIAFPGAPPIVFCGINNYAREMSADIRNVTGVVEATDHRATIDLMRKLHPERTHITVVLDRTPTGDAIREEVRGVESLYAGKLKFEFLRDFLLEEIPNKLASLGDNDLIYILTFNRDRNKNFISYTEGIEMISQSTNVPIYGSWDFYLGKGIVGGRITSGVLQGEAAGKLALKILHGEQVQSLKMITDSPTRYMFDYRYMKKHGIGSSALPDDSMMINAPPTPYEKYKVFLLGISALSFALAAIVLWKYKRQQYILADEHALAVALELKVKERTRELEIANKELLRLSNMDGLTQLYNRRYFDVNLRKEINRLQRTLSPISLLICDIDYFKRYNDTYGHLVGDECIRAVANAILKHCRRDSDVAARYGGEEFGVILPNTDAACAMRIAESIRTEIESKKIPHSGSSVKEIVSISIGVASITPTEHTMVSKLIALADRAMYESKSNGRDQVTLITE